MIGVLNDNNSNKAVAWIWKIVDGFNDLPTKGHLDVVNQGIKQYPEITEVT